MIGTKKGTTMTMNGKINFSDLYEKQKEFQKIVLAKRHGCQPEDVKIEEDLEWFKYHCLAMVEEMGEVVKADKRWKTHRNERYVIDEKLDEIADVFITTMNIAMFSGFTADDIEKAIVSKIDENTKRIVEKN